MCMCVCAMLDLMMYCAVNTLYFAGNLTAAYDRVVDKHMTMCSLCIMTAAKQTLLGSC